MAHTLLSAATATGEGSTQRLSQIPASHTVQVAMGGTVVATAVTVDLEGSLDDTTFFQLARHAFSGAEITAEAALFHVINKPVRYVRANLITLTGGTDPTVTVLYEPVLLDRS
jgi:hypothetical protein